MTRLLVLPVLVVLGAAAPAAFGRQVPGPAGPGRPGAPQGTPADPNAPGDGELFAAAVIHALAANTPVTAGVQLAIPRQRAIEATPRMQRLKALTFDRRPGAVLKAWAPKPPENDPAAADPSAPKKPRKKPEGERLDREVEAFQRAVTPGQWPAVRAYLRGLSGIEARAAYGQMLRSLSVTPMDPNLQARMAGGMPIPPQVIERNVFHTDDLVGL